MKVIIIDYLQLMTVNADDRGHILSGQEEAFILRTLKETAKELNVPIIVQSMLRKHGKRPQLSDLGQSSGDIEQASDVVVFIHRPEYYGIREDENGLPADGLAEFIIDKHHNGDACNVKLRFLKEQARFTDTLSDES